LPFTTGGPRCHDLALQAGQNGSPVTICIEAKADESFGDTVAMELKNAIDQLEKWKEKQKEKQSQGQKVRQATTKFPNRLDWLTRSVLGLPAFEDDKLLKVSDSVAELPYQLLSAIAGTLLEAEHKMACKAVLVIHELRTIRTKDVNLDANATALNHFLRLLLSANKAGASENFELESGYMIGPILITDRHVEGPIKIPYHIPLFIGKIRTVLLA
jgi:hypothetical protein